VRLCYFIVFILLFFKQVFAADFSTYYCANTFQVVKTGDTTDRVRTACGQPTSITTQQQSIIMPVAVTQWIYTLGLFTLKGLVFSLPTLSINFDSDQKITQINRSGMLVSAGYCAINGVINTGDPMNKVLLTCGQPNFISTQQQNVTTTKTITQWIYNKGPYQPQIIFNFEGNSLTRITSGQLGV